MAIFGITDLAYVAKINFATCDLCLRNPNAIPLPYQGQQPRQVPQGAGACFYQDADLRGGYFCMKDGERQPVLPPGFNDSISSIRVFGGARVRVFVDGNYSNASMVIDRDVDNLQGLPQGGSPFRNWNDCISSIVVFRGRDDWDRRDRNQGPPRY